MSQTVFIVKCVMCKSDFNQVSCRSRFCEDCRSRKNRPAREAFYKEKSKSTSGKRKRQFFYVAEYGSDFEDNFLSSDSESDSSSSVELIGGNNLAMNMFDFYVVLVLVSL